MYFLKTLITSLLCALSFAAAAAVDINKASQAELEAIKGIGTAMSQRMLDERARTPFADWTDVETRVKGVGPANAAKFSAAGLTVNGSGYAAAARPAAKGKAEPAPAKPARTRKPAAEKS